MKQKYIRSMMGYILFNLVIGSVKLYAIEPMVTQEVGQGKGLGLILLGGILLASSMLIMAIICKIIPKLKIVIGPIVVVIAFISLGMVFEGLTENLNARLIQTNSPVQAVEKNSKALH